MKRASNPTNTRTPAGGVAESDNRFISPRQLADRWDCSRTTAQRIADRVGFARYFLGEGKNGMVRYRLDDVEAYEEARRGRASSIS